MINFKEFLNEKAKKVKEPDWPDADYSSGFSKLRDMQNHLRKKHVGLQLFVPKRRDPAIVRAWETQARLRQVRRDMEAVKEEAPPILTSYTEAPPGSNKPSEGFWTSTARPEANGTYTSDWYEYVKTNHKTWQTEYGYLFEVSSSAMVFDISYADQYYEWAMDKNRMSIPKSDWMHDYSPDDMRFRFPWDQLAKHFDGAWFNGYSSSYGGSSDFTYGWDVESTVWFNTKVLKYKGAVRLWNKNYEED